jgi:hypothetical protein
MMIKNNVMNAGIEDQDPFQVGRNLFLDMGNLGGSSCNICEYILKLFRKQALTNTKNLACWSVVQVLLPLTQLGRIEAETGNFRLSHSNMARRLYQLRSSSPDILSSNLCLIPWVATIFLRQKDFGQGFAFT